MTDLDFRNWVRLIVVLAYGYQLCAWPVLFWAATLLTAWTGDQWPAPTIVPWEHLLAGTVTLASIGGIDAVKAKMSAPTRAS